MNKLLYILFISSFLLASSCKKGNEAVEVPKVENNVPIKVPAFSRDTAYAFVAKQVSFGPRVPGSAGHKAMQKWLVQQLKSYGAHVTEQSFKGEMPTVGKDIRSTNIIASFHPTYAKRVLLAAHWDTRFASDEDAEMKTKPADGADDGGSGVGVLLEIARLVKDNPIPLGVDFIFFDAEDQGQSSGEVESWCLGSQYWAQNPHVPRYRAEYGILLDMVGAKNAVFSKENVHQVFAEDKVNHITQLYNKVWELAASMGHGNLFINQWGKPLTDDHYFVNKYTDIPMIDIIYRPADSDKGFGDHWHTQKDNLSVIDPNVLGTVGQVVTAYLYHSSKVPL